MVDKIGIIDLKYIGREVKDIIYISIDIYDKNLNIIDNFKKLIRPINNIHLNKFDLNMIQKFGLDLSSLENSSFFGQVHDKLLDFFIKHKDTSFFIENKSKKDVLKRYLKSYKSDILIINYVINSKAINKLGKDILLRSNIYLNDNEIINALKNLYGFKKDSDIIFLVERILCNSSFKNNRIIKYYKNIDLYNPNNNYNFEYNSIPGEIKYGLKNILESSNFYISKDTNICEVKLNKKRIDYKKNNISTIYNSRYSDTSLSINVGVNSINICDCSVKEYLLNLNFYFMKNQEHLTISIPFNKKNIRGINSFLDKNNQYQKVFKNRA